MNVFSSRVFAGIQPQFDLITVDFTSNQSLYLSMRTKGTSRQFYLKPSISVDLNLKPPENKPWMSLYWFKTYALLSRIKAFILSSLNSKMNCTKWRKWNQSIVKSFTVSRNNKERETIRIFQGRLFTIVHPRNCIVVVVVVVNAVQRKRKLCFFFLFFSSSFSASAQYAMQGKSNVDSICFIVVNVSLLFILCTRLEQ